MTFRLRFDSRLAYSDQGEGWPALLVECVLDGESATFPAVLDTGAEYTLLDRDSLESLGLNLPHPFPESDAVRTFSGVTGASIRGMQVGLTLRFIGFPFDLDTYVFVSEQSIARNLIGRDVLQQLAPAFLFHEELVYLTDASDEVEVEEG